MKAELYSMIYQVFEIYYYVLIARFILTFFPTKVTSHPISQIIETVTEPLIRPFRNKIPCIPLGSIQLDLTMLVVLIVYRILVNVFMHLLFF